MVSFKLLLIMQIVHYFQNKPFLPAVIQFMAMMTKKRPDMNVMTCKIQGPDPAQKGLQKK